MKRIYTVRVDGALLGEVRGLATLLGHSLDGATLASKAVTEYADKHYLFPEEYPVMSPRWANLTSEVYLSDNALDELDVALARHPEAGREGMLDAALRWAYADLSAAVPA